MTLDKWKNVCMLKNLEIKRLSQGTKQSLPNILGHTFSNPLKKNRGN